LRKGTLYKTAQVNFCLVMRNSNGEVVKTRSGKARTDFVG
jgi:hypothetical protein